MRRQLILMVKYPHPGAVKTRLGPALGAQRACNVHRGLVAHTLTEVARLCASAAVAVEVCIAGAPDETAARTWLGDGVTIREQGDGDLGMRLERAIEAAVAVGAEAVVVIGGDCPQLEARHLAAAFAALEKNDLVLGPAADGGYYLIGLRQARPELFRGIRWSSAEVLAQTLAAARSTGTTVTLLETLHDVDVPDDLPLWAKTAAARAAGHGGVSVVIAAFNEEKHLPATLAAVRRGAPHEIIVVDGGSTDRTLEIARAHAAIALKSPAGRARQMNHGAAVATGEFLLFLHADTLLPAGYTDLVRATLARPGVAGGAFQFGIAEPFPGRRLIERGTNWRARHRQLPYGDQALFVTRETFARLGGFAELPIMEDYEFVCRLAAVGRVALAPAVALTSGRRWRRLGALRTTLRNQLLILGYQMGVAPTRLAVWYRRE